MAKGKKNDWNNLRPGRHGVTFDHLVSGLGEDCAETPTYSPSRTVEGSKMTRGGRASEHESAKDQRRG